MSLALLALLAACKTSITTPFQGYNVQYYTLTMNDEVTTHSSRGLLNDVELLSSTFSRIYCPASGKTYCSTRFQ